MFAIGHGSYLTVLMLLMLAIAIVYYSPIIIGSISINTHMLSYSYKPDHNLRAGPYLLEMISARGKRRLSSLINKALRVNCGLACENKLYPLAMTGYTYR